MLTESERFGALSLAWIDREIHDESWDLFDRYRDRAFSFVDCTSFVLARREHVDFVFGFDADFRTMGFDVRP
jgi:predicted nucleic acid-binding protein